VPGLATIDGLRLLIFLWVLVLGLLATAPIGAIIGALVKSSGAGFGLTFFPLAALVAISGIFYPISALPAWVQWIAQVFPVYWLGLGLRSVFSPAAADRFDRWQHFLSLLPGRLPVCFWRRLRYAAWPDVPRGVKWRPENSALFGGSSTILTKRGISEAL
jgi:ABC-2 type transport system permease protein